MKPSRGGAKEGGLSPGARLFTGSISEIVIAFLSWVPMRLRTTPSFSKQSGQGDQGLFSARYGTDADVYKTCDSRYPFVATTYRVSKHWQTGVMTRWQPWLLEAQPQLFVEMSHELAKLKGIKNGDMVIVESARGKVEAVAMATHRFRPFRIGGNTVEGGNLVHQVGLPWHFGWVYPEGRGDSANLLTPPV